jgi:hypothetical protein
VKHAGFVLKNRLYDGFVFFWLLSLSLYVNLQRSFPHNFDDEYGVLGAMAVFAGYDWNAPAHMPFYGFLLAIVSFPLYWLDLEPGVLYRSVLAVNAVLVATSAVLALWTIRLLSGAYSEWWRILAVIAGFSYPAVIYYSGLAKGETVLLFCFFFIAYHLSVLMQSAGVRVVNAILLGAGIGAAQYAHPRGVVFVIAAIMVLFYALRVQSILRKQFIVTAVSASLSVITFAFVKSHLLTVFYTHKHISSSLISFVDSKFSMLSIDRLIPLFQVTFGQLLYLFTSSFGVIIPGFAMLLFVAWKNLQNCEMGLQSNSDGSIAKSRGLLSGFVVLSSIIMFAASVAQMVGGSRADHFFYGRYNEVMVPALIIASIIFLSQLSKKVALGWIVTGFLIALLSALAIDYYPEDIFQRETLFSTITGWFVHQYNRPWKINPGYILSGTVAAVSVLAGTLALSKRLFVVVLILFFTSTVLHCFENQHKRGDRGWNEFNELAGQISHEMSGLQLQVRGSGSNSRIKGEALQIAFPKAHVIFQNDILSDVDAVLDYQGDYCHENTTIAYMGNASFCVVNEEVYKQFVNIAVPLHINLKRSRPELAPSIKIDGELQATGIILGRLDRVCALIANEHYTRWFRYFLPSVSVDVSQYGPSRDKNYELGVFITNLSGQWLEQWRVQLDNQWLERDESIRAISSVQVQSTLPVGEYWFNIAIVDGQGWDWREVAKIRLTME